MLHIPNRQLSPRPLHIIEPHTYRSSPEPDSPTFLLVPRPGPHSLTHLDIEPRPTLSHRNSFLAQIPLLICCLSP